MRYRTSARATGSASRSLTSLRLLIFGASGSGVTTLGTALSAKLGIPYFDSDDYFHLPTTPPFMSPRAPAERNAMVCADLNAHDHWILGGSIYRWGDDLFPPFDLIVFLYIPPEIRMPRLLAREETRYGDLIRTDPAFRKQNQDFILWAADYDHDTGIASRTLNAHEAWLKTRKEPILELRGDITVEQRMQAILAYPIGNEK